ncbi:MAG: tRNA lysidine(34) synthetase TilS [Acidobacteria bacterium]|nr:MAG: tRNA lysidine(34) synthetase TilS [Acidobacteriota bacterium]
MTEARTKKKGRGRVRLRAFTRRLLAEWERRDWPLDGGRVLVAVSGGADSTALLLALGELLEAGRLGLKVTAAHLDHGLRGRRGGEDARWVEALARAQGFEIVVGSAAVGERARAGRDNLEQAARRARYEFLAAVARERGAGAVLAAHTLDDQAETILLRLLRGSGAEGLCGMSAERALEEGGEVVLRRPLLGWARRADTEGYCRGRGVEFRSDEMNQDERFARVRVRQRLLPLLESFNPRAVEALARAAELLREDASALERLASGLLEEAREEGRAAGDEDSTAVEEPRGAWPLRVQALNAAPLALRRRALRQWVGRGRGGLRRLTLAHLLGVERLLEGARGGRVAELPGGCRVVRRRGLLHFLRKK